MVTVTYSPIKEVVVMEYIKYQSPEELLKNLILPPGQPAVLYWAEGVVFHPIPLLPNNDKIIEELIKGRVYWSIVSFAEMPQYSGMLAADKGPEALVVNVSRSRVLRSVAKWLSERLRESEDA